MGKQRINHEQKKEETKNRMRKKLAMKQGEKKICLTMIVKNESKNMVRLFNSIKSIIDMISIVDTGSTDDTEKVIINWGKKNGIPTKVHHEPFVDFSHNRTHSVKIAKETFTNADYFLLSDADFVWEIDNFDKSLLIDHKYLIEQYNKRLSYLNVRLLSSKIDWVCEGVTHEYWTESNRQTEYMGEVRVSKVTTLKINDIEDGGCKEDKFERDERLLRKGLNDPKTPKHLLTRYKFYLGQTLKDTKRYEESIIYYTKRVEDKGWGEEVFYAKFQIGCNYESIGWRYRNVIVYLSKENKTEEELEFISKWNNEGLTVEELNDRANKNFTEASVNYLAAYNYRKCRAESLYHCSRMYRMLSMSQMCYNVASIGSKIPYPSNDTLFIERDCYDYCFDFEISICCYYIPERKQEGREALKRLLDHPNLPVEIRQQVENNSRCYI